MPYSKGALVTTVTEELSIAQASEILGCSPDTIRNYIARGDLPAYRVKGSRLIRIHRADLDAMLTRIPTTGGG